MLNSNTIHRVLATVVLILLTAGMTVQAFGQGKLSRVRSNARKHQPATSHHDDHDIHDEDDHRPEHHSDRHNHGRYCDQAGGDLLFNFHRKRHRRHVVEHVHIFEPVCASACPSVYPVVSQTPTYQQVVEVPPPSQSNLTESNYEIAIGKTDYFSGRVGRITTGLGSDFDGLTQGSLAALLQAPGSFGLDTNVTMFRESGTSFRDHLWIGDVNLVYEAINNERLRLRAGIGINWLGDQFGGEAGGNLTFGLDWKLADKWIITAETDLGSIGDSDLFHAQASLARQLDSTSSSTEWVTGYDYYDIGGATIGGVLTGLRFRF